MRGISVIVPCFNAGSALTEAVNSVQHGAQHLPYEIIVIDDASPDQLTRSTLSQIEQTNPHVKVLRQQRNQGQSAARNRALTEARYDYILPLDADDKFNPDQPGYAENAVSRLESNPDSIVAYCKSRFFGTRTSLFLLPSYNEKLMLTNNMIPAYGIYRRSDAIRIGGYKESLRYCEDWEFWLALHNQRLVDGLPRTADFIPIVHHLYRQHNSGTNVSVFQKMPISKLFNTLTGRSGELYEHHLGTRDPQRISEHHNSRSGLYCRLMDRAKGATPLEMTHYVMDVISSRLKTYIGKKPERRHSSGCA